MKSDLLTKLNKQQLLAVTNDSGPLLVIAGPGSGKTRVIVHRVAFLISEKQVKPEEIMVVTFTNKASRELKDRLNGLLGQYDASRIISGTFHSIASKMLRINGDSIGIANNFSIYDREDQISIVRQACELVEVDTKRYNPSIFLSIISNAKSKMIDPILNQATSDSLFDKLAANVYLEYEKLLHDNQALDFDDLLLRACTLFEKSPLVLADLQNRIKYLLVDEFQDTNFVQYKFAKQLAGDSQNICVVGDPDQSIYSWRNADLRNILNFQKDFKNCTVVKLVENYRSTSNILNASQALISQNSNRITNDIETYNPEGTPIELHVAENEYDEASIITEKIKKLRLEGFSYENFAVTYRVNAQSRAFEEAFVRNGVPYKLIGALKFYQRREIKDIIAYLRIIQNSNDDNSMLRVINVPPRGIGERTVTALKNLANLNGDSVCHALLNLDETVLNIHKTGIKSLKNFQGILNEVIEESLSDHSLTSLLDKILSITGYREHILRELEGSEERWENIGELRSIAGQFDDIQPNEALNAFLDQVALVTAEDDPSSDSNESVTLITLHQTKGLEFPVVFIPGLEEGLLPHSRSMDSFDEIEEERRLFYVGITRAISNLYLSWSKYRTIFGTTTRTIRSQFVENIPENLLKIVNTNKFQLEERSFTKTTNLFDQQNLLPTINEGDKVEHFKFGKGVVVQTIPRSGDFEIVVAFKVNGIKHLLSSVAKLKVLE